MDALVAAGEEHLRLPPGCRTRGYHHQLGPAHIGKKAWEARGGRSMICTVKGA